MWEDSKKPFFSTFFEKREKILKSYSKNSCIFYITCRESWHFFSLKMKSKVPIATGTENFEHFQNHQKNTVFWYQITDSTKKVVEKTIFFHFHPLLIGRYFLSFFIKNRFFRKFFAQIYTFIKNPVFWHFFLKFFVIKVPIATRTENLVFFNFFFKNVFTIDGGQNFFCFLKQKIQIEHPYWRGGGSKSPFLKTRLWDY